MTRMLKSLVCNGCRLFDQGDAGICKHAKYGLRLVEKLEMSGLMRLRQWVFVLCFTGHWSCVAQANNDILVLQSHGSAPYQLALEGFKQQLAKLRIAANYRVQMLEGQSEYLLEHSAKPATSLVLSLGTPATRLALAHDVKTPLVAGLILDGAELDRHRNATGVTLSFPVDQQWQWFRRLLPEAGVVAVVFNPKRSEALFQALQQYSKRADVELLRAEVQSVEEFPDLLQSLPLQLDAVWALDSMVPYNNAAVRELLLFSFRNRIPLVGLSAQWVKAGALYALDWDYPDLGRQAAELANQILQNGRSPASLPPQTPRKIRPVWNSKTSEHMKIPTPENRLLDFIEVGP